MIFERLMSQAQDQLFGCETYRINFDVVENERVISDLARRFFRGEELKGEGPSSFISLTKRTLCQYLGWKYWSSSKMIDMWRSLMGFIAVPVLLEYYLAKRICQPQRFRKTIRCENAVFLPAEYCRSFIEEMYGHNAYFLPEGVRDLRFRDLGFLFRLFLSYPRLLLYPELAARIIARVSQYSGALSSCAPLRIVNFAEGSGWSSVMTAFCRARGIQHVNIMHGVRYFSSPMAFSEFDVFYVWGQYQLDQFRRMHVSANPFIISGNAFHRQLRRMLSSRPPGLVKKALIVFEIILGMDPDLYAVLGEVLRQIPKDYRIACRYHPLEIQRSRDFTERLAHDLQIDLRQEDPHQISLTESLRDAHVIIGCYSNALTDAWIAGKKCIYLTLANNRAIPLQEHHASKNVRIFYPGDQLGSFLRDPVIADDEEHRLKTRFSFGYQFSEDEKKSAPNSLG